MNAKNTIRLGLVFNNQHTCPQKVSHPTSSEGVTEHFSTAVDCTTGRGDESTTCFSIDMIATIIALRRIQLEGKGALMSASLRAEVHYLA